MCISSVYVSIYSDLLSDCLYVMLI